MTDALANVSLTDAAQALRDKIKSGFVDLLTPDQWQAMILAELESFTKTKRVESDGRYSWPAKVTIEDSEFTKICRELFQQELRTLIKQELNEPEFQSGSEYKYGNYRETLSVFVKAWLTENAASLIQATVQSLAGESAQRFIQIMQQQGILR